MNKYVNAELVKAILEPLVDETPGIIYNRNKSYYSEDVARAIKKELSVVNSDRSDDTSKEISKRKLNYLLSCKSGDSDTFARFDPKDFSDQIHESIYGMDEAVKEVTGYFFTKSLKGKNFKNNLAINGGYGEGKTALVEGISKVTGYSLVKIACNGITDIKTFKGSPASYKDSEPGIIIKGVHDAGSISNTIFQFDEIDKLKPDIALCLIDLLDGSFFDNYLGVSLDFSDCLICCTSNEWQNVPVVLRDRFHVVCVDGYDRTEKAKIVRYIISKNEKNYSASNVSITMNEEAVKHLLRFYCPSFGIRDAEKAMQKIVSGKLLDQAGQEDSTTVNISIDDIDKYLEKPFERGNFPSSGNKPGIAKALAVCNTNLGNAFAIETVLFDGKDSIEITGLPKETTIDSVKIAITVIRNLYPDLLKGKCIHVHFGEGSVSKDGTSAGVTLFMSILSAAVGKPVMKNTPFDIAFTGELSLSGGVFPVGGVLAKIQAASDSGCSIVFVPESNYERLDKEKIKQYDCEVIPVTDITQVVERVFPEGW